MRKRTIVGMKVLPGEPIDGTGKVCIHLVVPDPNGPFTEYHMMSLEEVEGEGKRLVTKPTKARLACDPKRLVAPIERNGVTYVTFRVPDPTAANCPKCLASEDYKRMTQPNTIT